MVSIPVWVSFLLRCQPTAAPSRAAWFQSWSGFSLCFDSSTALSTNGPQRGFNPGLGFLSASTASRWTPSIRRCCFNPGLGFLSASTRQRVHPTDDYLIVSIPVWVFSLLRRVAHRDRGGVGLVSIPVWVFSLLRPTLRGPTGRCQSCFNPGLGFLSASTRSTRPRFTRGCKFQSRSGFSLCFDPSPRPAPATSLSFNPGLGFLSASTL